MRAVVQRVTQASVSVAGEVRGRIAQGFMVLIGVQDGDTQEDLRYIAEKVPNLRVFEDENGKMNRSLIDIGGEILAVSQFTLLAQAQLYRRRPAGNCRSPVRRTGGRLARPWHTGGYGRIWRGYAGKPGERRPRDHFAGFPETVLEKKDVLCQSCKFSASL